MRPILVIDERPLHASREACSTPAAQTRILDHVCHFIRLHLRNCILERGESAVLLINVQLVKAWNVAMTQDNVTHFSTSLPDLRSTEISSIVRSTFIFS